MSESSKEQITFDPHFRDTVIEITSGNVREVQERISGDQSIPATDKYLYTQLIDLINLKDTISNGLGKVLVIEGASGVGKSTVVNLLRDIYGYKAITDRLDENIFLQFTKLNSEGVQDFTLRNQLMFMILKSKQVLLTLLDDPDENIVVDSWSLTEKAHIEAFRKEDRLTETDVSFLLTVRLRIDFSALIRSKSIFLTASDEVVRDRILGRSREFEVDEEALSFQLLVKNSFRNIQNQSDCLTIDTNSLSPQEVLDFILNENE